jgi:hypothetical protein
MPNLLVSALNAGELSPYMDARTDVEKYRSGCRTLENMIVLPYGGVYRRAGTEYLGTAKNDNRQCRLIGFNFSVTTRFVLEFGHEYIRVWGNNGPVLSGGSPLEVASPYQESELRELQYVQVNDIMYLAHANHAPRKLTRVADDNWTLATVKWKYPPVLDQNITGINISASDSTGSVTLTGNNGNNDANDNTFLATHIGSQWAIQWPRKSSSIDLDIDANRISTKVLDIQGSWSVTTVGTWKAKVRILRIPQEKVNKDGPWYTASIARTTTTATVTLNDHGFKTGDEVHVTDAGSPFNTTAPKTVTRTTKDTFTYAVSDTGAASAASARVYNITKAEVVREFTSLDTARNFTAVGEEDERVGLLLQVSDYVSNTNARVFLESTDFSSGGTVTIDAIGTLGRTATATVDRWLGREIGATTQWSEAAFSAVRGYPRAVAIHEQRLCFGGTAHQPNTVWCSKTDDFEDFQLGSAADSGLQFSVASSEGNRIAWMFSQKRLMLGTSGDEWTIGGASSDQPFSASNIQAQKQSSFGSKTMRAILLNDVLLFVQRRGRKVRELTYNFERDGWVAPDLTVLSEHITTGEIVELAFQQQPDAVLWAVRGDGELIGMSYERDQNVVAWHRHTTDGDFESVATVYGLSGADDEVWFCVKRTINGQTKRYIERFKADNRANFEAQTKADWWYLDCAKRYSGAATATITGLSHLEGKTVGILANGAVQPDEVVASGQIALDRTFTKVLAGLPFTSTILPMKFDFDLQDGSTRGRTKRINRAEVSLYKSLGGEFSTDGTEWLWVYPRDFDDPMDASPPPFSGDAEVVIAGNYSDESDLYLRQVLPYPLTVRALVVKLDAFGD